MDSYRCQNCDFTGCEDLFPAAKDLSQRMTVGDTWTDSECPKCGSLAFPVPQRRKVRRINRKRGKWALAAVRAFMDETGLSDADGLHTAIGDLLADLHHLCDAKGLHFYDLTLHALGHYRAEQTEEGDIG